MFCYRDYQLTTRFNQQNEKFTTSIKGLGACLLQEEKPAYFASKALTEAQKGYMAIEIESLAVA